jgi:signal transduction histidine kinase
MSVKALPLRKEGHQRPLARPLLKPPAGTGWHVQAICEAFSSEPMSYEQIVCALRGIDLFERFSPQVLGRLVRGCLTRTLSDGDILFTHGSSGSSLYIVLDGCLQVFRAARLIATVGPNEYVGELALIESATRSASARALGEVTLLEMPRAAFKRYLRGEPDAMIAMMRTIGRRLRQTLDDTQTAYEQVDMLVHDMLNRVNILGGASLVLDTLSADDEQRHFLEFILHAQAELQDLMQAALNRARGTDAPYTKESVQLDGLVHECLQRDLALHRDLQKVTVRVHVEAPIAPVKCHVLDMKRVIANLVINAAQALPPGGTILVAVRQDARKTVLSVTDNGPGIPPRLTARIFDPHFTTRSNGSGLGLSSCRDVIEHRHHGRLRCLSSEGSGTTFVCELPH